MVGHGMGRRCTGAVLGLAITLVAAGGCSKRVHATAKDAAVKADILVQAQLAAPFSEKTEGPSDALMAKITVAPGASTGGWHMHDGPVITAVAKGTATLYDSDDPTCTPHVMTAGQAQVEPARHIHIVRNESKGPLELYVTFLLPRGSKPGTLVLPPGNCAF